MLQTIIIMPVVLARGSEADRCQNRHQGGRNEQGCPETQQSVDEAR